MAGHTPKHEMQPVQGGAEKDVFADEKIYITVKAGISSGVGEVNIMTTISATTARQIIPMIFRGDIGGGRTPDQQKKIKADKEEILSRLKAGDSPREIAEALDIPQSRVYRLSAKFYKELESPDEEDTTEEK